MINRVLTTFVVAGLALSAVGVVRAQADKVQGDKVIERGSLTKPSIAAVDANPDEEEAAAEVKNLKVLFLAGAPSHGYGAHEHYAGCSVLARRLNEAMPHISVDVFKHDWPADESVFNDCNAIVMYCDGGGGHPANDRLELLDRLSNQGVGIVCLHYGVEVPKGPAGDKFLDWIGAYFETDWSVNPHWVARFESFPDHPVCRGVKPFAIEDEWYYHMRFRKDMQGITPVLSATPDENTLIRPDGPHSGNPHVRQAVANGEPQHLAWVSEREAAGRGFGFTGGHDHWNWGDDNFRRLVLNGIVWTAGGEVPEQGVGGEAASLEELMANQDYPIPEGYDWERAKGRITKPIDKPEDKR